MTFKIKTTEEGYKALINSGVDMALFQVTEVEIEENYSEDETWKKLRSDSIKAYKKLREYEYNKRH